jgi:cytidylate kinase/UDP-2,3-diacylglucosamine diphosphatase
VSRAPRELALPAGTRVIADLHLDPLAIGPWNAFQRWLETLAGVPALLVLGDLFEYWTGRAQLREADVRPLIAALARRTAAGTALHFLRGNRDFLLDGAFARAVGGTVHPAGILGILPDRSRVLFLHGDELATRDASYQRLRRVLRAPPVRALAWVTPAPLSAALARALRRRSRMAVAAKSPNYVALQAEAAGAACRDAEAQTLVCGHAHRFQDTRLASGARWIVLDAFGGARDLLRATDSALVAEASGVARARAGSLSSAPPMIIAIDGPAGVGKSTLARALARELGLFFLDTGAMYRAVTLEVLARGLAPEDEAACARVAHELHLDFDAAGHVCIDGRAGEPAIRGEQVTRFVSLVSAHGSVRAAVVERQRALAAEKGGAVAEGRDTTTVVFPDARHKFFLTASAAERAQRRARQENALERVAEIQADIERRDRLDSTRAHSPLLEAADAERIETDGLSVPEVLTCLLRHVHGERR